MTLQLIFSRLDSHIWQKISHAISFFRKSFIFNMQDVIEYVTKSESELLKVNPWLKRFPQIQKWTYFLTIFFSRSADHQQIILIWDFEIFFRNWLLTFWCSDSDFLTFLLDKLFRIYTFVNFWKWRCLILHRPFYRKFRKSYFRLIA